MTHVQSALAVAATYERIREQLLAFARRLSDPTTAEDLVQDAFVRIIEYGRGGEGVSIAYLRAVVRNLAHDLHARRARDIRLMQSPEREGEPVEVPAEDPIDGLNDSLQRGLEQLTTRQWQSLVLTVTRGLTEEAAAHSADVSRTAISGSRERAIQTLRHAMRVAGHERRRAG